MRNNWGKKRFEKICRVVKEGNREGFFVVEFNSRLFKSLEIPDHVSFASIVSKTNGNALNSI